MYSSWFSNCLISRSWSAYYAAICCCYYWLAELFINGIVTNNTNLFNVNTGALVNEFFNKYNVSSTQTNVAAYDRPTNAILKSHTAVNFLWKKRPKIIIWKTAQPAIVRNLMPVQTEMWLLIWVMTVSSRASICWRMRWTMRISETVLRIMFSVLSMWSSASYATTGCSF